MIQMSMQFAPRQGQQDLAWLAHTTGDLNELYNFLLRSYLAVDIEKKATKPLTESQLKVAVDGEAVQMRSPLVRMSEGSVVLQLSQFLDATIGVQVLAGLGLVLKKGADIVALPRKIQRKWFSESEEALRAKNAYERLKRESDINVIEPPPDQCTDTMP
jgi:hypothetical protein